MTWLPHFSHYLMLTLELQSAEWLTVPELAKEMDAIRAWPWWVPAVFRHTSETAMEERLERLGSGVVKWDDGDAVRWKLRGRA